MYSYEWNQETRGYRLTTQNHKSVASELRPVFAEELLLKGLDAFFLFNPFEKRPFLWQKLNKYIYAGQEIASIRYKADTDTFAVELTENVDSLPREGSKYRLEPVDIAAMLQESHDVFSFLVNDTLKRIKEMYDICGRKTDVAYIGFSGGKDSTVLLDLCNQVLPLDVPVVFSDTDMELPDTYQIWEAVQQRYPQRIFLRVKSERSALENWHLFGPPSQALRWCCSVHKSSPAFLALKKLSGKKACNALAFTGVRSEESLRRSTYSDISEGLKISSQTNVMPLLSWSSHELWLYIFQNDLLINKAYRSGLPRVGCLLCPMSSAQTNSLIQKIYPSAQEPFIQSILSNIDRGFPSEKEAKEFIRSGGWNARNSGVSLQEVIYEPEMEVELNSVSFSYQKSLALPFKEWLKALKFLDRTQLSFQTENALEKCVYLWKDTKDRVLIKNIGYALHKAMACIGCRVCESECPTGALKFIPSQGNTPTVSIDSQKCIHCLRCYSPDEGCLRYYSKRYAGGSNMGINGFSKYLNFGLKPEWIELLASEGSNFRYTNRIGNRMVPSAISWFKESGLIENGKTITPTKLLDIGMAKGVYSPFFWQIIWMELANTSPLIKWFVCFTEIDKTYTQADLLDDLASQVSSESVRRGGMQALCNLIKNTPLSQQDHPIVKINIKGKVVKDLTRQVIDPDLLVLLHGFYMMADKAKRSTFTIRQMMQASFDSDIISPLVIFGLSPEDFKRKCLGLATRYPQFITCNFTLGLDEVRVLSDEKTRDEVYALILES